MTPAPDSRLSVLVDAPVREDGEFVLYWMIAERRPTHSFGLQHAVHHACAWGVPLLVLEPLDCTYRWASDRFHAFVIAGFLDLFDATSDPRWLRRALTLGPVAQLELEREDTQEVIEVALPLERFRHQGFREGELLAVRPRRLRVFVQPHSSAPASARSTPAGAAQ